VIDAASRRILEGIIRREGHSLLVYVSEAFPWVTSEEQQLPNRLKALVEEEAQAVAALGRYLAKQRLNPPGLGSYPVEFTSYNNVGLDFLLPLLVEEQERSITSLQAELSQISDLGAKEVVRDMVDMKRRHLDTLRQMRDEIHATQKV
jgi:hypothetical protein